MAETFSEQVKHAITAGTVAAGVTLVSGGDLISNCDKVLERMHKK